MDSQELVGRTIAEGRYQILRLLGEGGMGAVFQARQIAMDRMVALKLIRPEIVVTKNAVARFHKEMLSTARVEHPNTVRVYDFGETDGQLFLTMEFLSGPSLGDVIEREGPLPLERIVHVGRQVAKALGAAHERAIVHRDLKPDNVMLVDSFGERDFVKVVDFGVAKSLDEDQPKITATGSLIGTPAYMAPEQALGREVDPRTDLYALGVMLYQMASGRVPFHAPTMGSLLVAHATEPPPPLDQVAPGTAPALVALVMQLLEKDPADRPQSAGEVVARLDACVGLSGAATVVTPRSTRRARWPLFAGIVLALGAGGTIAALMRGGDAPPAGVVDAGGCEAEAKNVVARARDKLAAHPTEALELARQAIAGCPAHADGHNVAGNALQKLGRLEEAEDAYVRALGLAPSFDAPRFNLGILQLRRKDASALATFTEILRRNPDHPDVHLVRAQAYLLAGRAEDALADLEEAVRRQPRSADAWAALGQLREKLRQGDAQAAYCQAKALGHTGVDAFCK